MLDLGRVMAVKEQLQTAVDAGSLAGSLEGVRYVKVRVPDRYKRTCSICCSDVTGKCRCCNCKKKQLSDYIAVGTRIEVWDKKGWRRMANCGSCGKCCKVYCGKPVVEAQWIEFPGDTEQVAVQTAQANLPADVKSYEGGGGSIDADVHSGSGRGRRDPLAPSVVVKFSGWIKSMLAGSLFKADELDVNTCGQSGTFFYKLSESGRQTKEISPRPEPG